MSVCRALLLELHYITEGLGEVEQVSLLTTAMAGLNIWIFYGLPLLLLLECTAFNLDHESVLRKNGEPGSFFGFSMAMHWQLRPSDKRM